jgi:hypothetical protein
LALLAGVICEGQQQDVEAIVQRSVAANDKDFQAASNYNYEERERAGGVTKLYQVTMIGGTPYQRLLAVNGEPLSESQNNDELKKQRQAEAQRRAESSQQRRDRIAKYKKEQARDHEMMAQLTEAFDFTLVGTHRFKGFHVYVLKATPRRGYKPPNTESQVLPGMQGEMWIDQQTYRWVKVTAKVIRTVSIEGFLAQVEPGTEFEIEKAPVGDGIWQITHFAVRSKARILHMINRASEEEDTFFDFEKATGGHVQ